MPEAIIMMGLPGCGKSEWIKKLPDKNLFQIVSADDIKDKICKRMRYPWSIKYSAADVHEMSVQQAKTDLMTFANQGKNVIMDSGGINNKYTETIIKALQGLGYIVKVVYIDTPVEVCLERNALRNREVPVPREAIIEKAVKAQECLYRYRNFCNVTRVQYFTNRHVFLDMDGTIAAYQHIPLDSNGNINFVKGRYFKNALPVLPMIAKVRTLWNRGTTFYILSAAPDNLCQQDKVNWLCKNKILSSVVKPENAFFIGNKRFKNVMLENIRKQRKLDKKDVTLVDDDHKVITDCHQGGINAVHPSYFLTDKFYKS